MSQLWEIKLNKAWKTRDIKSSKKTEVPDWALAFVEMAKTGYYIDAFKKFNGKLTWSDVASEMEYLGTPRNSATCHRWAKGQIEFKLIRTGILESLNNLQRILEQTVSYVEDKEYSNRTKRTKDGSKT